MKQEFCDNLAKVVPAAWKTHIRRIPAVEAFLNTAERRRDPVGIYNRSIINLGMGGILGSEELTSVKGRDFEVTGTGGAVYVTSYNPDLARHFSVGEEILCYSTRDEMLEIVRDCLSRPDECREMARKARERCVSEHRWLHRYMKMLEILGIFPEEPAVTAGRRPRSGEISDHPVGTAEGGRAA